MPGEIVEKERTQIEFKWADSNSFIVNESGELSKAGTCVFLNGNIVFLAPLTDDQLKSFKETVTSAIDHELDKRLIKD